MDLNTVREVRDARRHEVWQPGDAWLGGGTYLYSEPQPQIRRLIDLSRTGWEPLSVTAAGDLEIAATCTIAQLSRYPKPWTAGPLFEQCCRAFLASWKIWNMATVGGNLCNGLPAGPMISLTAALDGVCLLRAQTGALREVPVAEFVVGAGRKVLREGELLRSVTLPARALAGRTAFRQASLYGLGRSGALVIGRLDPPPAFGREVPPRPAFGREVPPRPAFGREVPPRSALTITVTASTVRPIQVRFPLPPNAEAVREAIEYAIEPGEYYDDIHGRPAWRRHMTLRFAEEIRRELLEPATTDPALTEEAGR